MSETLAATGSSGRDPSTTRQASNASAMMISDVFMPPMIAADHGSRLWRICDFDEENSGRSRRRVGTGALPPPHPSKNRTCEFPSIRLKHLTKPTPADPHAVCCPAYSAILV